MIVVTILLLVIVIFIGYSSGSNTNRALYEGRYQPSEIAKIATIIYLSVWLNSKREDTGHITPRSSFLMASLPPSSLSSS